MPYNQGGSAGEITTAGNDFNLPNSLAMIKADGKLPTSILPNYSGGVTNGDFHDHNGGDGAQISYTNLSNIPSTFAPEIHGDSAHSETYLKTFKYGLYTLSGNQTSNLSTGNHIEFNTSQGSLGGLSTGSGQENGIITLAGGKTYKITFITYVRFTSTSGVLIGEVYDNTNSTALSSFVVYPMSNGTNNSSVPINSIIISPETEIDIIVRFTTSTNIEYIFNSNYTTLLIEEYAGY